MTGRRENSRKEERKLKSTYGSPSWSGSARNAPLSSQTLKTFQWLNVLSKQRQKSGGLISPNKTTTTKNPESSVINESASVCTYA